MASSTKKIRRGQRVRYTGSPALGPPTGSLGTVGTVATGRGHSIHPDPLGIMTFVNWDGRAGEGVYTRSLVVLEGEELLADCLRREAKAGFTRRQELAS